MLRQVHGQRVEWDVMYYDKLQNTVGGGKPKMKWHFTNTAKVFGRMLTHADLCSRMLTYAHVC